MLPASRFPRIPARQAECYVTYTYVCNLIKSIKYEICNISTLHEIEGYTLLTTNCYSMYIFTNTLIIAVFSVSTVQWLG